MVFHWNLSDCKSLNLARTLLSILDDLNTVVVSMASAILLASNNTISLTKPSKIVPSAPMATICPLIFSSLIQYKYFYFL